jgi:fluoride ion exporter CrcB/FEX
VKTSNESHRGPIGALHPVLAVAIGGALGTLVRILVLDHTDSTFRNGSVTSTSSFVSTLHLPWGLLAINTLGVFVAACLLSGPLRHRSPNDGLRLLTITGFLGGLTSYSSLIRDVASLRSYSWIAASALLVGAILAGVIAAVLGARLARR